MHFCISKNCIRYIKTFTGVKGVIKIKWEGKKTICFFPICRINLGNCRFINVNSWTVAVIRKSSYKFCSYAYLAEQIRWACNIVKGATEYSFYNYWLSCASWILSCFLPCCPQVCSIVCQSLLWPFERRINRSNYRTIIDVMFFYCTVSLITSPYIGTVPS